MTNFAHMKKVDLLWPANSCFNIQLNYCEVSAVQSITCVVKLNWPFCLLF